MRRKLPKGWLKGTGYQLPRRYDPSSERAHGERASGRRRGRRPANAYYPTTVWEPGEIITDEHVVSLPAELAPGQHTIQVVLYSGANGERLPVSQGNQPQPGDRLVLQSLVLP